MAITNGYTTLAAVKDRLDIDLAANANDALLEDMITQTSRGIDRITGRTFYPRTETHLYSVPAGRDLVIDDDDLLTIATLTNGDSEVLTTADYYLYPRNTTPKWAVILKQSSTKTWNEDTSGNSEGVISIVGTWGYSATTPEPIANACIEAVIAVYRRRFGNNTAEGAVITPSGTIITPSGWPKSVLQVLQGYMRFS